MKRWSRGREESDGEIAEEEKKQVRWKRGAGAGGHKIK